MTIRQYKLCKKIVKYRELGLILKQTKITNAELLQDEFPSDSLDFSDYVLSESTIVTLSHKAQEDVEAMTDKIIDHYWTRGLAIAAIIISVVALVLELGILRLTR